MIYTYAYKTSDGQRHEATVDASSREDAFATLRAQGIRPIKVVAADGSKANGEVVVRGVRRRMAALIALIAAAIVGIVVYILADRPGPTTSQPANAETQIFESKTRHQVIGDTARVQKGILDGWSEVFSEEGERFLAGFAVPGVPVSVRNTTEDEIREALARSILPTSEDGLEARQIKSMVEGMKEELREFLRDGGTIVEYGQCLVKRQETEIAHYNRAKAEIDRLKADNAAPALLRARWEAVNDRLRSLGIKLVPLPEE